MGGIEGFKSCLPVLYLDGCFGRSAYKGQVIAATGRNGNKGIYPLAVCVCASESEDNWNYFLNCLKPIIDGHSMVVSFISDRGLGLLKAFPSIFLDNPHLFCYYHMKKNLRKRFAGKGSTLKAAAVEKKFFRCAYSSTPKQFKFNMDQLRVEGGRNLIDTFFKDLPVESWCRAFGVGSRYGIMENSVAECFNNWISLERAMPVYTMLEEVRLKIIEMISKRRLECASWGTVLTPEMEGTLEIETNKGRRYRVISGESGVYEVRAKFSYVVNLNERTCSCRK